MTNGGAHKASQSYQVVLARSKCQTRRGQFRLPTQCDNTRRLRRIRSSSRAANIGKVFPGEMHVVLVLVPIHDGGALQSVSVLSNCIVGDIDQKVSRPIQAITPPTQRDNTRRLTRTRASESLSLGGEGGVETLSRL